jgi:DNA-binding cell septation regulator SpoVG
MEFKVNNIKFIGANVDEAEHGLLGWISCTLNHSLRLDGLALRQTRRGRWTVSFPSRLDASGRRHFLIRPLDDATRREIERQIFRALQLEEAAR